MHITLRVRQTATSGLEALLERRGLMGRARPKPSARGSAQNPKKVAYAPSSLQICVTRKQTVTPITTGMSVATVVHFALRVSL